MPERKPVPVRLGEKLINRLDAAAESCGTTRANLIRFCTDTFLRHFEKHGKVVMPPDWEKLLEEEDGRSTRYRPDVMIAAEDRGTYGTDDSGQKQRVKGSKK